MEFVKRHKFEILLGVAFIVLYFFLRLTNLLSLPIFTDEAIYVRWSQIAAQDASWRFISLTDGKQPMYVWVAMVLLRFIHDPLLAGRLVAVGSGFVSMIGMYLLASELFENSAIGFLSSFLYIIFPFALVYDRMAMYDSMVGTFIIWGLYIEVLLVRRVTSTLAFIAGLIIGAGMLTKTNTFFNMYFLPFTVVLFDWRKKDRWSRLLRWAVYALIAVALANMYYAILRLSPYYGIIGAKNASFIEPFSVWIHHPFMYLFGDLQGLFNWFISYVSWFGALLAIASFFVLKKYWREKLLLLFWFAAPFFALAFFGKIIYPRYIFPMTLTLLPLIAVSLYGAYTLIKQKYLVAIIFVFFLLWYVRSDYYILYDFSHAPIAQPDLVQYENAWPAGGGVNQMVAYFAQVSQNQKIYVASEGTFGSVPTLGMEIYLDKNTNIQKQGIYPVPSVIPADLLKKAKSMPVYMVFEQTQIPPIGWPLRLIAKYQKGIGNWYMSIYQVIPQGK